VERSRHHEENFLSAIRELCDIWRKAGPKERAVEAKIEQALMEISTTNRLNQLELIALRADFSPDPSLALRS